MIQPEPEDLPKDNPKLEIAVLRFTSCYQESYAYIIVIFAGLFRVILFSIHNDEMDIFQVHLQTALRMSMLVKDIRSQDGKDDKDNDKGSKSRSQSMKEQAYNETKTDNSEAYTTNAIFTDLMKEYRVLVSSMNSLRGRLLASILLSQ
ncbi:hypothetical protein Tco_1165013 [Tanacetum coccineum]